MVSVDCSQLQLQDRKSWKKKIALPTHNEKYEANFKFTESVTPIREWRLQRAGSKI